MPQMFMEAQSHGGMHGRKTLDVAWGEQGEDDVVVVDVVKSALTCSLIWSKNNC